MSEQMINGISQHADDGNGSMAPDAVAGKTTDVRGFRICLDCLVQYRVF